VERATAASTFTITEADWRANIVSRSQLMEDRLALANRAAGSEEPVLLTGENGTGKELLARAIHAASARREKPFITVSCRNMTAAELSSELFGDERDGSSGKEAGAEGAFQRACGGTLLLDEVGDLPMRLQIALAEALSPSSSSRAVGTARAAARLICTTSSDLKALAASGEFLTNLYYQINILPIEIPPLGRRREDIPLLVSHFLEQATEPGGQKKIYSSRAIELLATTDWPGNVRQLFDLVKQNVALSHGKVMTKEFVQKFIGGTQVKIPTYNEARDEFSRDYLVKNMQQTAGNVTLAARLAKRNRTDFYNLLARYRLHPEDFKTGDREHERAADSDDGGSPTSSAQ
jgi:two-component system response regulator GlrR